MELIGFVGRLDVGWEIKRGVKDSFEIEVWIVRKLVLYLLELGKIVGGI